IIVQVLAGNVTGSDQMDPQQIPIVEAPDATITPDVEPQILQQTPLVEVQRDGLNDQALEDLNAVANNNNIEAEGEDVQQIEGEHSTTNNNHQQQHMEG
ncbi:hypothetical protein A2U01_0073276, partial [Trifolium medium]|nr:hypothetical protein [Trifolium medium]